MLKVLAKFGKVLFLLTVMIIMNPHRAILIPFSLFAAAGSWLAWRLEDLCQWLDKMVDKARKSWFTVGRKTVGKKLDDEMEELNRLVLEVDKRFKEKYDV